MSNDNKEAKKEELLKKQEARQLTEAELEQVTGGTGRGTVVTGRVERGTVHLDT